MTTKYINPNSELARRFWENERLDDCPIYDFHGHMHELIGGYLPAPEPEDMLVTINRSGIRRFVFCSHLALYSNVDPEKYNIEPVKKYNDVFRAYMGIRSFDLDFDRDIETYESNPDVYIGFKFLQDYFHVALDAPCHEPYWKYADERGLICLSHTWGGSPYNGVENVRAVAEKYHNVKILCGHSFHGKWDCAAAMCNEYPNIYLELTAVLDDRGALEQFVRECGSEKILFGTDLPWFSTFHAVGSILDAEMTDDDRHNIFHRNGERLLNISQA
jgi:predicted TIM-barrel fold metal-dependent hydrolase